MGVRAVYCALDPATAVLEVALHRGFAVLDAMPHVMTAARIVDPAAIFVVDPAAVPNANWLRPGVRGRGRGSRRSGRGFWRRIGSC